MKKGFAPFTTYVISKKIAMFWSCWTSSAVPFCCWVEVSCMLKSVSAWEGKRKETLWFRVTPAGRSLFFLSEPACWRNLGHQKKPTEKNMFILCSRLDSGWVFFFLAGRQQRYPGVQLLVFCPRYDRDKWKSFHPVFLLLGGLTGGFPDGIFCMRSPNWGNTVVISAAWCWWAVNHQLP